jgi:hypothetical protein
MSQKEPRSIEELMQAQFMSLSIEDKTRVLLPLLAALDSITKESVRSNDATYTDNNASPTQGAPNRRQTPAALPKTISPERTGDSPADSLRQEVEGQHSEPDWYQNLLHDEDELPQTLNACGSAWSGCAGCFRGDQAQVRNIATAYAQVEDAASNIRSHNTANG